MKRLLTSLLIVCSASTLIGQTGYPIERFLGVMSIREVSVSPDGRQVAFITAVDDFTSDRTETAVWIWSNDRAPRRITEDRVAVSNLRWSRDDRHLSFLQTSSGNGATRLRVVRDGEPVGSADFPRGVSDYDWARDQLIVAAAEHEEADRSFYGDVIRHASRPARTTIYRVTPDGKIVGNFSIASNLEELRVSRSGEKLAYVSGPPSDFGDSLARWEVFVCEMAKCEPRQVTGDFVAESSLTWSRDDRALYFLGSGDPDASRNTENQTHLYRLELDRGRSEDVAPRFAGSIEEFTVGEGEQLLGAGLLSTSVNLLRIDPSRKTHEFVTSYHGAVGRLSSSADGRQSAFVLSSSDAFPELYVGSVKGRFRAATAFNQTLTSLPKPLVETIRWPNGEGDIIEGILYWPPGKRGAERLPLVVSIHGGPTSADFEVLSGSANNYPALLASRGYLVLRPNYRGSVGRGDEFTRKISGYFCSRPVTDILTGVDFVAAQGWADSQRMAVMGYSYGGVLTGCVITRSDRFRAAISGAGVWNYISRFGTSDNFITYDHLNLGKSPWDGFEQIWRESAISQAHKITTPTLIVHGAADRRVHTSQSLEMYRALVRLGVESELLLFPDEGHAFRKPSHKLTKVRAEIGWIDRFLQR